MRITGGEKRGLSISSPSTARPTSGRVRESLFSILGDRIKDRMVLDLFCGSGILGIEALSRGAKFVVFIDSSLQAVRCVRKNLERVGFYGQSRIIRGRFPQCLKDLQNKFFFDVIFADPPYGGDYGEEVVKSFGRKKMLKKEGLLVLEHQREINFNSVENLMVEKSRNFGGTSITIFRKQ